MAHCSKYGGFRNITESSNVLTAKRFCPCKQPACPAIAGGSEVTSYRDYLALTSPRHASLWSRAKYDTRPWLWRASFGLQMLVELKLLVNRSAYKAKSLGLPCNSVLCIEINLYVKFQVSRSVSSRGIVRTDRNKISLQLLQSLGLPCNSVLCIEINLYVKFQVSRSVSSRGIVRTDRNKISLQLLQVIANAQPCPLDSHFRVLRMRKTRYNHLKLMRMRPPQLCYRVKLLIVTQTNNSFTLNLKHLPSLLDCPGLLSGIDFSISRGTRSMTIFRRRYHPTYYAYHSGLSRLLRARSDAAPHVDLFNETVASFKRKVTSLVNN
ncbi:hypothetical protein J6590_087415 [Homalodisca vitripennis]|nr:hypothetical protein J6590_087415 [Homalodisca vitripennis]